MTLLALLLSNAHAGDAELFEPHGDAYGYTHTQGASTLGNLQLGVGAWVSYANDPVVLVNAAGERVSPSGAVNGDAGDALIDSRLGLDAQVAMGFTKWTSLSVRVPVVLQQSGWDIAALDAPGGAGAVEVTGLDDVVVTPKFALLHREDFPVGMAVIVPVGVPTGSGEDLVGAGGVTASPMVALETSDAPIRNRAYRWRGAVNLGWDVRPTNRLRDATLGGGMSWATAAGVRVGGPVELTLEAHGRAGGTVETSPAEALLGVDLLLGKIGVVRLAGGTGIVGGVGAPDWRAVAGFTLAPSFDPRGRDTDDDGMFDGDDACPNDTEDKDGFQDDDGCPDRDNDADGREDGVDQCVNDPEDDDGFMDNDGCPEPDNDKDGVADMSDRCPDQAETVNGNLDDDGCPDDDPAADSDGDGFRDTLDRCPYDAEDANGFEDDDGCPDARVVIKQGAIEIREVIYFDTAKSTIQARSFDLMDELARVIVAHPELKRIRVEGHTDNVGNPARNKKLSGERAKAVVAYLVGKGVEADRLVALGLGEEVPIAENTTEDGRSKNRRVEFIILKRE